MNRLHPTETNLRLFLMLDAVLTEGSVTRAADHLGITQSAVSHGLRRLRTYYKDPLLVRSGNGMRPTPLAAGLLPHIKSVVRELDAVLRERGSFDPAETTRTFALATVDYPFLIGLDRLFERFRELAPRARLIVRAPSPRLMDELADGTTDLTLGSLGTEALLRQDEQLMRQRVITERFCCLMREGHPLLAGPLTMEAILSQPQIAISFDERQNGPLQHLRERYGIDIHIAFHIPHFMALPPILACTDAVAIVPEGILGFARRLASLAARELPVADQVPSMGYIWWHRRMHADPGHIWFREQVASAVARSPSSSPII